MDTSGWGKVYALPTAGPTPGDAGFLSAFTQKFPTPAATGVTSTWNCNVVNTLDAVPLAWTNLSQLTSLYPALAAAAPCIPKLQKVLVNLPGTPNPFAAIPQVTFNGALVPPPKPPIVTPATKFASEALYQHLEGYVRKLTPDFKDAFKPLLLSQAACVKLAALCAKLGA